MPKSAAIIITKEGTEFTLNINEDAAQTWSFENMESLKIAIKHGIGENKMIDRILYKSYTQCIWKKITEFSK